MINDVTLPYNELSNIIDSLEDAHKDAIEAAYIAYADCETWDEHIEHGCPICDIITRNKAILQKLKDQQWLDERGYMPSTGVTEPSNPR